jgi:hypothetical protein
MKQQVLPLRLSEARGVFVMSASDNLMISSLPKKIPEFSENEMKPQVCYR